MHRATRACILFLLSVCVSACLSASPLPCVSASRLSGSVHRGCFAFPLPMMRSTSGRCVIPPTATLPRLKMSTFPLRLASPLRAAPSLSAFSLASCVPSACAPLFIIYLFLDRRRFRPPRHWSAGPPRALRLRPTQFSSFIFLSGSGQRVHAVHTPVARPPVRPCTRAGMAVPS